MLLRFATRQELRWRVSSVGAVRHCHSSVISQLGPSVARQSAEPEGSLLDSLKLCFECAVEKPVSQYWRRKASKDGLQYVCKPCQKQAAAELRQNRAQWQRPPNVAQCHHCDELKHSHSFSRRLGAPKGLQYECKQCASRRMSQLYMHNKENAEAIEASEKFCCRCKLVKPTDDFYQHSNHKDGLQSCCKVCTRQSAYQRYHDLKSHSQRQLV